MRRQVTFARLGLVRASNPYEVDRLAEHGLGFPLHLHQGEQPCLRQIVHDEVDVAAGMSSPRATLPKTRIRLAPSEESAPAVGLWNGSVKLDPRILEWLSNDA